MKTIKWVRFWMMFAVDLVGRSMREHKSHKRREVLSDRLNVLLRQMGKQIAADDYVGDRADACADLIQRVMQARERDLEATTEQGLADLCKQCEQQLARKYHRLEIRTFHNRVN